MSTRTKLMLCGALLALGSGQVQGETVLAAIPTKAVAKKANVPLKQTPGAAGATATKKRRRTTRGTGGTNGAVVVAAAERANPWRARLGGGDARGAGSCRGVRA